MRRTRGALCALIWLACGTAAAAPVPITWGSGTLGSLPVTHSALFVPVEIAGLECLMQLDTGANTVFYRDVTPAAWIAPADGTVTAPSMAIGGAPLSGDRFPLFPTRMSGENAVPCSPDKHDVVIGTLGTDSLQNGSIVIDLATSRVEFVARGVLSTVAADHPIRFATRDGVDPAIPLLSVTGRHGARYTFMLDTGSAGLGAIFYSEADWLAESTHRAMPFEIPRWGAHTRCGHGDGQLGLGRADLRVTQRLLYCDRLGDEVANGDRMAGVIGLLPFENQRLTIDFVDRLARVEPSHANP